MLILTRNYRSKTKTYGLFLLLSQLKFIVVNYGLTLNQYDVICPLL